MDEARSGPAPERRRRMAPVRSGARAGTPGLPTLLACLLLLGIPGWLPSAARLPVASTHSSSASATPPLRDRRASLAMQHPVDGQQPIDASGARPGAVPPVPPVQSSLKVAPAQRAPLATPAAPPAEHSPLWAGAPTEGTPINDGLPLATYWDRLRRLESLPAILQTQPLASAERSDPLFGVADALSAGDATAPIMRGMGAAVDRVEFRLDQLEPSPDVYDFSALDNVLAMNGRLGFSLLAVVDGTPSWAAADSVSPGNAPPQGLDQPAFRAGVANPANPWACFLATLAAHYRSQVAAWEIWNEPNTPAFWRGTPAQYARLLAVAREVLARRTPQATIVLGGMVSDDGAFLRSVVAALCPAGPCPGGFGAIAWHVYDNPADISRLAQITGRLLQPHGLKPQIWITEANVPVDDPQAPADAVVGPDAVSLKRQAAFVLQAYALARLADIHTLVMYRASDVDDQGHYWGLLRGDGSARPALLAFRTAARWLGRTRALGVDSPQPGVTVARFCGSGQQIDVIWNDTARPVTVLVPAGAAAAGRVDATGAVQPLSAVQGVWRLALAPAAAPTLSAVALGLPTLLVIPGACGA